MLVRISLIFAKTALGHVRIINSMRGMKLKVALANNNNLSIAEKQDTGNLIRYFLRQRFAKLNWIMDRDKGGAIGLHQRSM